MNGKLSPWQYAQHFRRDERTVTATGINSVQLLAPNPNRIGAVISLYSGDFSPYVTYNLLTAGVDTSTAGAKQTTSIPSGNQGFLRSATFQETAATGVVASLQMFTGATWVEMQRFTTQGTWTGNMPFGASHQFRWNVITPQPASTADFILGVDVQSEIGTVTLSFQNPAVYSKGINLSPNAPPLVLWKDVVGDALTEGLYAVCNNNGFTASVWDLFY
jgi:hypothetical protein